MGLKKYWHFYFAIAVLAAIVVIHIGTRSGGVGTARELLQEMEILEKSGDYRTIYDLLYDDYARERESVDSLIERSRKNEETLGRLIGREIVRMEFSEDEKGRSSCFVTTLRISTKGQCHEEYLLRKYFGKGWRVSQVNVFLPPQSPMPK